MINALACPRCSVTLKAQRLDLKTAWLCESCAGLAINLAALRSDVEHPIVSALWQLARKSTATSLPCPSCKQALRLIHYMDGGTTLEADLCLSCQMIWLDYGEIDAIRSRNPASSARPVQPQPALSGLAEKFEPADDLRGIGTAADVVDRVLRIIWSTFH
jgi:Zn-finger nucleic acid-binding protein